jgi:hypothetical protein
MNNGINFCPNCGEKIENELNTPLYNGADGTCEKCECYFEAYILER